MLLSTFLFSFYFCFPSIPLDKISHEESRLFSKFIKDQCWQKVKLYYEKLVLVLTLQLLALVPYITWKGSKKMEIGCCW